MDVSLPSQPSDVDDFQLTKDVNSTTPVSSAPSTPTGPEQKTLGSSVASSVIAMEEDSMSTTNSLSPVPIESDSKQSKKMNGTIIDLLAIVHILIAIVFHRFSGPKLSI